MIGCVNDFKVSIVWVTIDANSKTSVRFFQSIIKKSDSLQRKCLIRFHQKNRNLDIKTRGRLTKVTLALRSLDEASVPVSPVLVAL